MAEKKKRKTAIKQNENLTFTVTRVEGDRDMTRPFYVIRILQGEKQPVYWKSHSWPASPSLGEATIFRDANAAGDIRQTVQTWTTGTVDIVAVNLESIIKEN